ncbi:K02A2.6-like protein [Phytophthora palmivora]|uniref:K02A2.6-like protein n=1 Tax=Phytophthora palmivora TaxID=4796 RepID=A0A2P4XV41_9STRA|nr:K02A2.6-like protein [Phytophthora palmivora]
MSPDFKPVHAKPYAVPRSMQVKAKAEIQRLSNKDVLKKIYDSAMASPTLSVAKPSGSLRLQIDVRRDVPNPREILYDSLDQSIIL